MRDDYYELLGLQPGATSKEVSRAFRKVSLKLHPDKVAFQGPQAVKAAEADFALVREAYEVLSDPSSRGKYDQRAKWISSHPDQVVVQRAATAGVPCRPSRATSHSVNRPSSRPASRPASRPTGRFGPDLGFGMGWEGPDKGSNPATWGFNTDFFEFPSPAISSAKLTLGRRTAH
ncbi:unnamed protein product [Effrenium voratum]|nr:unnamed protein product [Effrenium voratum]|mmetsp:Transcript_77893/g.186796  ORF Transcript_77893/g.186796 Transcript_77893/m.186796 type:complete len:175 (+) Transcript_77893:119-643(+)